MTDVPRGAPVKPEPPFALSVDVEDYFQVQAFVRYVSPHAWNDWPSRVERNTRRLLDLFDERGARATFFTLGWVARKVPGLVKEIAARGHEVASHGMNHVMITEQKPDTFRVDALESKALLEDCCGAEVIGFRAPSYSVNGSTLWALEVLAECGYQYDSSIYPIRRRRYGYAEGPTRPAMVASGKRSIAEFPLPTVGLGPVRVPVLAGAYLRLLPSWMSVAAARSFRDRGEPLVVNVHPWEIDPDQPVIGPGRLQTWTHYARLSRTEPILREVLASATFRDVATRLRELGLLDGAASRGRAS